VLREVKGVSTDARCTILLSDFAFLVTMVGHEEVGIGDFVLLDEINMSNFMENLRIR
jgi:hypothetical protein